MRKRRDFKIYRSYALCGVLRDATLAEALTQVYWYGYIVQDTATGIYYGRFH